LADFLEFGLNLLTVVTDGRNMLIGTLGLLLLLDRRDYAPGSTSSADNVLVGNGQKVSLVNGKFSAQLCHAPSVMKSLKETAIKARAVNRIAYLGNLFHVCDHLIITLGLLAEPREEGLAVGELASIPERRSGSGFWIDRTFHAAE
jgi:hypothetical protein